MTRLLTRRPALPRRRERAPRGRHRLVGHRVPRPSLRRGRRRLASGARRAPRYAAAGLLVLTAAAPARTHHVAPAARPVAVRPLARSAPRAVRARVSRARRSPVRAPAPRWVLKTVDGRVLTGRATWYGPGFAGRRTASGETFDPRHDLTAAHRTLPFGTRLRVCRAERCVTVRINDRGPFGDAILDLSWLAAERIGLLRSGIAPVTATVLTVRRVRAPR